MDCFVSGANGVGRRSFLRNALLTCGGTLLAGSAEAGLLAQAASSRGRATTTTAAVPISLIGLPYLMGTRALNTMYGMAQGPVALLAPANAPAALRSHFRDVSVEIIDNVDEPPPPLPRGDQMARILTENIALAGAVRKARMQKRLPMVSIGTCSGALGMVGGLADEGDIGMIWFDAHADAETPDTTSNGFIEGMVVPMIGGQTWLRYSRAVPGFRAIPADRIVSVGLSSRQWPLVPGSPGAPVGTPVHKHEIDRLGIEAALGGALDQLAGRCKKLFIHMDADSIDPSVYRNFLARPDITGMTLKQMETAFAMIADRFEILAVDFSAYDPTPDPRSPKILASLMLTAAIAAARSRPAG